MQRNHLSSRRGARAPLLAILGVALGCLALGCGSDPKPAAKAAEPAPNATNAAAAKAPARQDTSSPTSGSLHIDDKIVKACGDIPTAHFAFDSAKIGPEAAGALDAVGRCFTTGPLKGRSMRLTGFADPRGEIEYNMGLGQKRAGSVADYLAQKGVEKARLQTNSKGSLEATGTDEEGWARDRKVEVTLLE